MEEIKAYKATDGKLFATSDECQEYELLLIANTIMNEFIASEFYPAYYSNSTAKQVIQNWEKFKKHKNDKENEQQN